MVLLVLVLGVLMNHIRPNEEYILGYSVGPYGGITYGINLWIYCWKISGVKDRMRRW